MSSSFERFVPAFAPAGDPPSGAAGGRGRESRKQERREHGKAEFGVQDVKRAAKLRQELESDELMGSHKFPVGEMFKIRHLSEYFFPVASPKRSLPDQGDLKQSSAYNLIREYASDPVILEQILKLNGLTNVVEGRDVISAEDVAQKLAQDTSIGDYLTRMREAIGQGDKELTSEQKSDLAKTGRKGFVARRTLENIHVPAYVRNSDRDTFKYMRAQMGMDNMASMRRVVRDGLREVEKGIDSSPLETYQKEYLKFIVRRLSRVEDESRVEPATHFRNVLWVLKSYNLAAVSAEDRTDKTTGFVDKKIDVRVAGAAAPIATDNAVGFFTDEKMRDQNAPQLYGNSEVPAARRAIAEGIERPVNIFAAFRSLLANSNEPIPASQADFDARFKFRAIASAPVYLGTLARDKDISLGDLTSERLIAAGVQDFSASKIESYAKRMKSRIDLASAVINNDTGGVEAVKRLAREVDEKIAKTTSETPNQTPAFYTGMYLQLRALIKDIETLARPVDSANTYINSNSTPDMVPVKQYIDALWKPLIRPVSEMKAKIDAYKKFLARLEEEQAVKDLVTSEKKRRKGDARDKADLAGKKNDRARQDREKVQTREMQRKALLDGVAIEESVAADSRIATGVYSRLVRAVDQVLTVHKFYGKLSSDKDGQLTEIIATLKLVAENFKGGTLGNEVARDALVELLETTARTLRPKKGGEDADTADVRATFLKVYNEATK